MSEKYTVITGASSGIGREIAKVFAKKEKNLILVARRTERLEELKKEILCENSMLDVKVFPCDLSDIEAVYRLYDQLKSYNLETWINDAGVGYNGNIVDQDLKKISNMIHLNIEALTILSTLFVNDYKDTIINE